MASRRIHNVVVMVRETEPSSVSSECQEVLGVPPALGRFMDGCRRLATSDVVAEPNCKSRKARLLAEPTLTKRNSGNSPPLARNPVERVSWNDATEFCRKVSELTGKTVRLPTMAEWE